MEEYYLETTVANSRVLCIGPITRPEAAAADSLICDGFGHYLYLANATDPNQDIEILAKIVSDEAADRLGRVLSEKFIHYRPASPAISSSAHT